MTVMLSSHLLPEVEELCNRVAIVRSGSIVFEGALDELKRSAGVGYSLRTTDDERAQRVCEGQPGVSGVRLTGGQLHFSADEQAAEKLSVALIEAGVAIRALSPETATLEDLFFRLTEGEQPARQESEAQGAPV
jgi:ABC-2 type transport system ATP-binding protein